MPLSEELRRRIRQQPPLSPSATALLKLLGDTRHGLAEVTRVVELDPTLAGLVLKVANSALLAQRTAVTAINRAVQLLGDRTVAGIALGACARNLWAEPLPGYAAEPGDLWRHSLLTALAARELSRLAVSPVDPGEAYTAGLLHDLGKAVLAAELVRPDFSGLGLEPGAPRPKFDFLTAERIQTGTDHCEVGAALAEHWGLPLLLRECLERHHYPQTAGEEHRPTVYVTHLADMLAMQLGAATGADALQYPLDEQYHLYVRLRNRELESLQSNVLFEAERMIGALPNPGREGGGC